jgi:RNA polymerase sigma factor (sigma-70 family)
MSADRIPLLPAETPRLNGTLPQAAQFLTTHWSVVDAVGGTDSPAARQALERLCQTYWYPLYAFVRRKGSSPEEAEDLTQGFFERAIEKKYFAQVDRSQGRFRAYLLACLKHFLADARDHERAAKRGGGKPIVSFDSLTAAERYQREPADTLTPEKLYDLQWARALVAQARARLREEYAAAGKNELHTFLNCLEPGAAERLTYAEIGRRLNKTESAIKNEAARLRQRFHLLLRDEVSRTVITVPEIDDEIRYLVELLGG